MAAKPFHTVRISLSPLLIFRAPVITLGPSDNTEESPYGKANLLVALIPLQSPFRHVRSKSHGDQSPAYQTWYVLPSRTLEWVYADSSIV